MGKEECDDIMEKSQEKKKKSNWAGTIGLQIETKLKERKRNKKIKKREVQSVCPGGLLFLLLPGPA